MKKVLLPAFIALAPLFGFGQETAKPCISSEMDNAAKLLNPNAEASRLELEQFTKDFIKNGKAKADPAPYIIPMVFHIIHDNGSENIDDSQIHDVMRIINEDFMAANADLVDVVPEFQNLIGKANIQFRLATKDPQGNCTNGIEHIYSYKTNIAGDDTKLNPWERSRYLNIWVANNMIAGASAYAYKPASVNTSGVFSTKDGIIALHTYVGSIGTSSPYTSRTITHEIGHYLNLSHVWGDGDFNLHICGDDGVSDTPLSPGWTTCDLAHPTFCDTAGIIVENIQNFMEYSFCNKNFTIGQCELMTAAINSSVSGRNNLWQPANLELTGTAHPEVEVVCAPLSDFFAERTVACAGDQIKFHDQSNRAAVTSWLWEVPGATPSTSILENPTFTFPNYGSHTVSLTTTNSAGSNTKTWANYIEVKPAWTDHGVPFNHDFADVAQFDQWTAKDKYGDNHYWKLNSAGGYGGGNAVYFNNWQGDEGVYDELISPSFDFTYCTNIKLNFKYSVATNNSDLKESLVITATNDCGKSWKPVKTIQGPALFNAGQFGTQYVPTDDLLWTDTTIAVPATFKKPNVRFKFVFNGTGKGNNVWLDNFNVDATVGIDDKTTAIAYLSVYPNPTAGEVGIRFEKLENNTARVKVLNMLGQVLHTQDLGYLAAGEHDVKINANLSNGLYVLVLESGLSRTQSRFVVNK